MTTTVAAVTQAQSLAAIRNFIRVSISCITYARGLCSDESFEQRTFLGLQLKHIIPNSLEATTISRWIEKGAFDALNRNYLKEMALCVYNGDCSETLESYCFGFTYSEDGQHARMTLSSSQQLLPTTATDAEAIQRQCVEGSRQLPLSTLRRRRCSKQEVQQVLAGIITKLVEVVESLPPLLRERVLTMRLTYYDEVTPRDYEPPCFAPASGRMVRFYLEEQKHNVCIGSMDTSHHLFSVSIRHPLLSKVQSKFLRHETSEEWTFQSDRSGTAVNSWLNDTSTGLVNPSLNRSNPFKRVDGCNRIEDEKQPELKCNGKDSTSRCRTAATSEPADVDTTTPLAQLLSKPPPLRMSEVVYLIVAAFIFIKTSNRGGGRGRLIFSELKDSLRESCSLEIGSTAVLKVVHKMLAEGYLQEIQNGGDGITNHRVSHIKSRCSGAADLGRSSGGSGAAIRSSATASTQKPQKKQYRCSISPEILGGDAVEVASDDVQWELCKASPSPTIFQGLLRQPQVVEMLSAAEHEALQHMSGIVVTYRSKAKRTRSKIARNVSMT